jgi:hypothetical protein
LETRREFIRKSLYAAPVILSVAVRPAFARSGYEPPHVGGGGGTTTGGGDPITVHSGGDKDAHDWWMFWRKL